jgi:hypothetical protein
MSTDSSNYKNSPQNKMQTSISSLLLKSTNHDQVDIIFIAEDIFFNIFSFIDSFKDMAHLSQTCTFAYNAFNSEYFRDVELYQRRYAPHCVSKVEWDKNSRVCILRHTMNEKLRNYQQQEKPFVNQLSEIQKKRDIRDKLIYNTRYYATGISIPIYFCFFWSVVAPIAWMILWILKYSIPLVIGAVGYISGGLRWKVMGLLSGVTFYYLLDTMFEYSIFNIILRILLCVVFNSMWAIVSGNLLKQYYAGDAQKEDQEKQRISNKMHAINVQSEQYRRHMEKVIRKYNNNTKRLPPAATPAKQTCNIM